jgi:hypothetical protein
MTVPQDSIQSLHCNECGSVRRHTIQARFVVEGDDDVVSWENSYQVLECAGCGTVSFRARVWFSEHQDPGEPPHFQDTR